jgi:hypothetical protein
VIRGAGDEPHPVVHQRSVAGDIVLVVDQPSMAVRSSRRTRFRWTLSRRSLPVQPELRYGKVHHDLGGRTPLETRSALRLGHRLCDGCIGD